MKNMLDELMKSGAAGGVALFVAAVIALLVSNSPLSGYYLAIKEIPMVIQISELVIDKPLLLWINDGLMAIFFFLVGLEIKREIFKGELSSFKKAMSPLVCAVFGLALPALIYTAFNAGDDLAMRGWAIPAATDIAFALGVLMLLGPRVPIGVKVFLTAVAIFDDLGAIIIIAMFYTDNLSLMSLGIGLAGFAVALGANLLGVRRMGVYVLIGIITWVAVLKSGVHATIAGVLIALAIPVDTKGDEKESPLEHLEHALHPFVAFFVLPVFAFANAGVDFRALSFADLFAPIPLGIALGLIVGKQVGIFGASYAMARLNIVQPPTGATWPMMYATAALCGIGFTMSLFIGGLAFSTPEEAAAVRLGVLGGSLISGIVGYFIMKWALDQVTKGRARPVVAEA